MFHLEAQNKLTESSEVDQQEIAEGAISVGEDNSNRNSRRLRRKRWYGPPLSCDVYYNSFLCLVYSLQLNSLLLFNQSAQTHVQ